MARRRKFRFWAIVIIIASILLYRRFGTLEGRMYHDWKNIIYTSNGNVAVAIYSPKNHKTYYQAKNPNHKFHTASTVKVSILAGLLLKQSDGLSKHQYSLAEKMIEESDNDSTTELFEDLGEREGLQDTFEKFGMNDSVAKQSWGLTLTTPRDQIKLLNNIFYSSNVLNSSQRKLIADLMNEVEMDQRWGISAGSGHFALKNGWLNYGKSDWIVNSIGYITNNDGSTYTIAVYTDKNTSMENGQQTIEQIARIAKSYLK
ncbi:MAG: serine hydrolase [Limosilactobacillus sp.]|uniref:serine hydrolase n=1 Tax=Limosilactobacillus sp. TaxID=2773925 RepID=UPI0026FB0B02|nr:serine hydrolase [Limosilactobacillus sp.]